MLLNFIGAEGADGDGRSGIGFNSLWFDASDPEIGGLAFCD